MLQIILYNQLHSRFIQDSVTHILYVHHTGKIIFWGKELKLNTKSKILDYAGGKNFIQQAKTAWLKWDFVISKDFFSAIFAYCRENNFQEIKIVTPNENFVKNNFLKIQERLKNENISLHFIPDTYSFLISHQEFLAQFPKPPIMEFFYRFMRKKFQILMLDAKNPVGWKWNFDEENRKFDKNHTRSWDFSLEKNAYFLEAENFYKTQVDVYPTTRAESITLLKYFISHHLDTFWKLEDAMYQNDAFVHHSQLSTALNMWFLSPLEIIQEIEKSETPMNNKEWFIRQILWWREFMYHFFEFYKWDMYEKNFFGHNKPLDDFFRWKDLDSVKMNCVKCTLKNVVKNNYGHHIERLMIIGNFALLYWYDPHSLNRWFFESYTDAFEWVVTPNVLGMSQFSDWGRLATKPYISSGAYINKMSDYCKSCVFDIKEKYTPNACPFNYLYWNFIAENKQVFEKSRQGFITKQLENIDLETIKKLKENFNAKKVQE